MVARNLILSKLKMKSKRTKVKLLKIPRDTIEYNMNGKVTKISEYCNVNNQSIAIMEYTRKGNIIYESIFDEHHGICHSDKRIGKGYIPPSFGPISEIFKARTPEGIAELKKKGHLGNYVQKLSFSIG